MSGDLRDSDILITGGTGSFGRALVTHLLGMPKDKGPRRIIIYSRDELKQFEMQRDLGYAGHDNESQLRFFLGDVRDGERLRRAFMGVDYVVHAAALKQVPACEYNPQEAVKTNVIGACKVVESAIDMGVKRVIALSTDKACNPANLYGATKLVAEKIFIAGNNLSGALDTKFSVVRYGNVVGSRGSVVPLFRKQADEGGPITITDPAMTRFWITLPHAVEFVLDCLGMMHGGEVFVPRLPTACVVDLANAIIKERNAGPVVELHQPGLKVVGIRPGEKLHETLITAEEAPKTICRSAGFVIGPKHELPDEHRLPAPYSSDANPVRLSETELRELLKEVA